MNSTSCHFWEPIQQRVADDVFPAEVQKGPVIMIVTSTVGRENQCTIVFFLKKKYFYNLYFLLINVLKYFIHDLYILI